MIRLKDILKEGPLRSLGKGSYAKRIYAKLDGEGVSEYEYKRHNNWLSEVMPVVKAMRYMASEGYTYKVFDNKEIKQIQAVIDLLKDTEIPMGFFKGRVKKKEPPLRLR